MRSSESLTERLQSYSSGYREGANALAGEILPRLRQIASRQLRKRGYSAPLTPTELVNETWLLRLQRGNWTIQSREHFFALSGKAMESVLIDLARRAQAERRGSGAMHIAIQDLPSYGQPATADAEQVIAIGHLLGQLERNDALTAFVVRQHYVAGFSLDEIADAAGLTRRQVRGRWEKGKLWLAGRLRSRAGQAQPEDPRSRRMGLEKISTSLGRWAGSKQSADAIISTDSPDKPWGFALK
jgi:RNA polymerase sigma factor (TIGR02999 family)